MLHNKILSDFYILAKLPRKLVNTPKEITMIDFIKKMLGFGPAPTTVSAPWPFPVSTPMPEPVAQPAPEPEPAKKAAKKAARRVKKSD